MKRIFDKKYFLSILLLLALTSVAYFPVLKNISSTSIDGSNWSGCYIFPSVYRNTIINYKQLPLRTHLLAGGHPSIGFPEDWSLNPFSVLILLFGENIGLRLIVFLLILLGGLGMFYLTKNVLKYNHRGAFFSSSLFILSPLGASYVVEGLLPKMLCFLTPWLIAFYLKSLKDKKFIIFCILILSVIVTTGALLVIPVIIFLFILAILNTIKIKTALRLGIDFSYLKNLALITLFTFLLCSVKILPMLELLKSTPDRYFRPFPEGRIYGAIENNRNILEFCFNTKKFYSAIFDKHWQRDLLSIYFGYIPIFLLFLSLIFYRKEMFAWFILLLVFTIIMFGPNSPIDLLKFLWHLCFYTRSIIKPDRFFSIFIVFLISLISGKSFLLFEKFKRWNFFVSFLAGTIILFTINDVFWAHKAAMKSIKYEESSKFKVLPILSQPFFQISFSDIKIIDEVYPEMGNEKWVCPLIRQDIGIASIGSGIVIPIKEGAIPKYIINKEDYKNIFSNINKLRSIIKNFNVNPSYKGESFFLSGGNEVTIIYFSPNIIKVNVKLKGPDTLIINQNYHRSWRSNRGMMTSYNGLLAVKLSEGKYQVTLKYIPIDFYVGLAISLMTLAAMIVYIILVKKSSVRYDSINTKII